MSEQQFQALLAVVRETTRAAVREEMQAQVAAANAEIEGGDEPDDED